MIVLGILTDGRAELMERTLASVREHLSGAITRRILVNDSGDTDYELWLRAEASEFEQVHHASRRGLAGAVQSLWDTALRTGCDYLFHLEGDWTFNEPIDLDDLVQVIEKDPGLAQVVLQRQALTPDEHEAGGVAAHDHWVQQPEWVEQTDIFSLNPCLIPRWVLEFGWPAGPLGVGNETGMTRLLDGYRFAFYGRKDSAPQVCHIGSYRADGWML